MKAVSHKHAARRAGAPARAGPSKRTTPTPACHWHVTMLSGRVRHQKSHNGTRRHGAMRSARGSHTGDPTSGQACCRPYKHGRGDQHAAAGSLGRLCRLCARLSSPIGAGLCHDAQHKRAHKAPEQGLRWTAGAQLLPDAVKPPPVVHLIDARQHVAQLLGLLPCAWHTSAALPGLAGRIQGWCLHHAIAAHYTASGVCAGLHTPVHCPGEASRQALWLAAAIASRQMSAV